MVSLVPIKQAREDRLRATEWFTRNEMFTCPIEFVEIIEGVMVWVISIAATGNAVTDNRIISIGIKYICFILSMSFIIM